MTFACYRAPAITKKKPVSRTILTLKNIIKLKVLQKQESEKPGLPWVKKSSIKNFFGIFLDYVISEFSAVLDNAESIVTLLFLLLRNWINLMAVPRWNKWFLLLFIITIECCFDSVLATFKAFSLPVNGTTRVQKVCGWTFLSYSNGYWFLKQQTS